MSEATKPVDTPIVAPITETPVVDAPTTESKPTESADPVVAATEPTTEEVTPAVKEEVKPVEEGILGYKGPGLFKSVFAQKKFFWFGTEPVESKSLSGFLRGEKPESGNHTVAWASHTGNGLLFFSKKASEKATPAHVFNLSEVTDVTPESLTEFHFQQGGHKHTFIASTVADRDNWLAVLKSKIEEAKTLSETVKDTEEYKSTHTSLTKPFVAVAAPKKSTEIDNVPVVKEEPKEEKAEAKEEKKEEKKEIKEEKKTERKSRSQSRKRTSIFGSIGFGKKEEKPEVKEETPVASTEEAVAPVDIVAPVEAAPTKEESPAPVEPVVAAEPRPTPAKRNSIFDSFKSFPRKEKKPEEKKAEEAPVVAKEVEPVSETAPVIPAVKSSEPLSTDASPSAAPVEETAATNGETKAVEAPAVATKSDKRKSSLPWLSKKKETTTSDEEGEKPLSPFAKLRATVKGKASPKTEKAVEKTPEPVEVKKEEEPVVEGEAVKKDEPTPVATATPQVAAAA